MIPIIRDEYVVGLIEVVARQPVEADVLQTLSGFALQTAVAISHAQAADDPTWKARFEEELERDDEVQHDEGSVP